MASVREQFRAHQPDGIVRRKGGERKQCGTVPHTFRNVLRVVGSFSSLSQCHFSHGEIQGEVGEVDGREVAVSRSLLNSFLSVCHMQVLE